MVHWQRAVVDDFGNLVEKILHSFPNAAKSAIPVCTLSEVLFKFQNKNKCIIK